MKAPQTLGRRLVPALAVTAVCALVLGAVASAATGEPGEEAAPVQLPAEFGIEAPRLGDAWRYDVALDGGWTFAGPGVRGANQTVEFGRYGWAETSAVRGGDGLLHDANLLVGENLVYEPYTWNDYYNDYDSDCYYDPDDDCEKENALEGDHYWTSQLLPAWQLAGTHTFLQAFDGYADNDTYTDYGFGPTGLGASITSVSYVYEYVDFQPESTNCFALNALQGTVLPTSVSVPLFEPCTMGGMFLTIPRDLYFHATTLEVVAGVQTIRYEAEQNGTFAVNFAPGIPYPIQFAMDLPSMRPDVPEPDCGDPVADPEAYDECWEDWGDDFEDYFDDYMDLPGARSAVLTLAGFRPGTAPLDAVDDPQDRDAAPGFVMAPRKPWGMDDSGIEHPFPLSEAYSAAVNATNYADLRTYRSGHPQAYVAAASYEEYSGNDGLERSWRIGLTDGDEPFGFTATKKTYDRFIPGAARGALGSALQTVRDTSRTAGFGVGYEFRSDGGPYFDWYAAPPASKAPANFPTVASVADRWAVFDGSGTAFNSWGFYIGCHDYSEVCETPSLQVIAGHVHMNWQGSIGPPLPNDPLEMNGQMYIDRGVYFESDGTAIVMSNYDDRTNRSAILNNMPPGVPPPPDPPESAGSGGSFDYTSGDIQGVPPAPWLPGPKEAAGISFIAVLLGAVYWLWPKLKVLAFLGLFSRLKTDDLLEHPARQRLLQLVESQPGIHLTELQRRSGLPNGTLAHHMDKLRGAGLVVGKPMGGYTCYFARGTKVDAAAPALKSEGARQIMDAVRSKPGLSNLEVAHLTGLQPSTVNYHVQRLASAGAVGVMRDGRNVRLHAMRAS